MKHIYYKNDFAVEITLLNDSGDVVSPPDWQWHIEFTDGRRKYICSVDKGNAKVVGNTIMCYLDNHKFCCGEIGYKFVQAIPDLNYLDGFQNLITPKALPIELWEQESDNDINIQSSVVPAYVVYDAYMTAKANGYTGTAEEFYDALNHIVDINKKEAERVEAEANRVTAEQQRVENFVAMESALTTATSKANTATTKAEEASKMADNSATAASQATTQATTATKRANDISADLEAKREADYWRGDKGDKGDKGDTGAKGDRGEKGDQGERGLQGVQGVKGDDGVSPKVTTSKTGKVTTIEITDAKGTHTATVNDGESVEVVQSTGTSTTAVMSQKAVSDIVDELESQMIYDVTANNSGATFDSLSALLSNENLSTIIPSEVRCGGMSIRFVQSSDNKYVQYRLMNTSFSTTLSDWQGVDDEPITGSENLVKSDGVYKALYNSSYKVSITSWRDVKLLDVNYYLTENGGKVSNQLWSISDFIRVSEGNIFNYKLTGYSNVVALYAFYDEAKKYITNSSHIGSSSTEVGSIIIPSGVSFIRFCGRFNKDNPTDNYDSNGDSILVKDITKEVTEIKSNLSSLNEKLGKVDEIVTDVERLNNTFIKSVNLFDKNNVDIYTQYGTQWRISAYIEVTPNIVYTVIGNYGYEIFQYSEDKTYLRKIKINSNNQIENIFLDDVKYIRIILNESNLDYMFFYEGICKGAYVPYGSFVEIPEQEDKRFDRVTEYNNLWNPKEYSERASLSYESGIVIGAIKSYVSPYIAVNAGDTYLLSKFQNYIVCSYNANKEFIRCISRTGDEHTITIQEGEIYVRISGICNDVDNPDAPAMIFVKKTEFNKITSFNTYIQKPNIIPSQYEQNNSLYGKIWNAMGDSITEGSGTTTSYIDYIVSRTGVLARGYGRSNTAIAERSASVAEYDMVNRYQTMADNADYITIFGGTNDHGNNIPIGQWGDEEKTTLYGAMKVLCEGLITKYMGKKIGFILPLPKYTKGVDFSYPNESFTPYIECIKDVCKRYSIQTLDLYTGSNIAPKMENVRNTLIPDGLHPNAAGHELISFKIQRFLESL